MDTVTVLAGSIKPVAELIAGSGIPGLLTIMSPFLLLVFRKWHDSIEKHRERRRKMFADAYTVCMEYKEYPYVIYRRNHLTPEDERHRISSALTDIQKRIAYHQAWLGTESKAVAIAYNQLVESVRHTAGSAMKECWSNPPVKTDAEMTVQPKINLRPCEPYQDRFIEVVSNELRPAYLKVLSWIVKIGRPPRQP